MIDQEKIKEIAASMNWEKIERAQDWKNYEVYEPVYDKVSYVGLPFVILANDNEVRLCTEAEALERIDDIEE